VRYLEEVLCEDDLFDRPPSRVTHTVQQVLVAIRGILKYHTIPIIDKDLAHHNAADAFKEIMKHLIIIISDCSELLWHTFRATKSKDGANENDKSSRLLKSILTSPDICNAMPDTQREVRERVLGPPTGEVKPTKKIIGFGPGGKILLHEEYVLPPEKRTGSDILIELATKQQLETIFVGDDSGFEPKFRNNHYIAEDFLKAHAFLLEFGSLYAVLQRAKECAETGGTLLVYGLANAQLNALLEMCDDLIGAMRTNLNMLVRYAEVRFEELVYSNDATVSRCPWIIHFKQLPSLLAKIEKRVTQLLNDIGKMRSQANSMTLYEQFQKAQEETTDFLTQADGFAKHMSGVLGLGYTTPEKPPTVKVPELKDMQAVLEKEVSGSEEGAALMSHAPSKKQEKEEKGIFGLKNPFTGVKISFGNSDS